MTEKKIIREKIKDALAHLSDKDYVQLSKQTAEQLFRSSEWRQATVIALTISREREVDTYQIIQRAWDEGKRVAVPRTDFTNKSMTFHEIQQFQDLERKAFHLKEPIAEKCPVVRGSEFDLVIVPGLAFSKSGARLGFGGGFYDRFLPSIDTKTVALAFPCQMIHHVPVEEHDRKIDHIIGPEGFYR
ncbi:5-formyltetrahydrofolate cyclo-ligase [bacterium LRH843]|nr:5-formyltetrahydrofolate cyclo-ligase [bacterium LRH843]